MTYDSQHVSSASTGVPRSLAWCLLSVAKGHHLPPLDDQIFTCEQGEKISEIAKDRLNDYGLVVGCEFAVKKVRPGKSIELACKHHRLEKANRHGLQDPIVRTDSTTGEVISDRQRNRSDHRAGC